MVPETKKVNVEKAQQIWAAYQDKHDVSSQKGQAVGIDSETGQVWFGESTIDIMDTRKKSGLTSPLYFLRVGKSYYWRKGYHE